MLKNIVKSGNHEAQVRPLFLASSVSPSSMIWLILTKIFFYQTNLMSKRYWRTLIANLFSLNWKKAFQDELIGRWYTYDGGEIHILFGSAIQFDPEGRGFLYDWGTGGGINDKEDPPYDLQIPIEWKRIGENLIVIKKEESQEWTSLTYRIYNEKGPQNVIYKKLISEGNHSPDSYSKEWFWNIPDGLYRPSRK
jgi:hypothetical protein